MSLSVSSDYSQFYKGTEQLKSYGSGNGKKETIVRYEFNTTDEHGNKVMDKMSKEESFRVMNDITSQYGDNVLVSFSGDGLAALETSKGKLPIPEQPHREIPEGTFTALEGPKVLSEEELSEMRKSGGTNMADVMRKLDPNAYKEFMSINEEVEQRALLQDSGLCISGLQTMLKRILTGWIHMTLRGSMKLIMRLSFQRGLIS